MQLKPTHVSLCIYTGETLAILGYIDVQVEYDSQVLILPLFAMKGQGPSLFGRNWLEKIKLNWSAIHAVTMSSALDNVLQKHQNLFHDHLGTLKQYHTQLTVAPTAQLHFSNFDQYHIYSE